MYMKKFIFPAFLVVGVIGLLWWWPTPHVETIRKVPLNIETLLSPEAAGGADGLRGASASRVTDPAVTEEPRFVPSPFETGHRGRILGKVVDTEEKGVPSVAISTWKHVGRSDETGQFIFTDLAPGTYRLDMEPATGFLPPWRQQTATLVGRDHIPTGMFATLVIIPPEGGDASVTLHLFRGGMVRGIVVSNDGRPLEGVDVCARSTQPGLESLEASGVTNSAGIYELHPFPGAYRTQVRITDPLLQDTLPVPIDFTLVEGETRNLLPLRMGGDGCTVSGQVVDDDGHPFPGLDILCYLNDNADRPYNWKDRLTSTKTDADGRYTLLNLPARYVAIQIAPDGFNPHNVPTNLLAWWIQPVKVNLHQDPTFTSPVATAIRNKPYVFEGVLKDEQLQKLRVMIELRDPRGLDADPWVLSGKKDLDIDKSGMITWACSTPHPPVKITVQRKNKTIAEIVLFPEARTERREFTF